MKAAYNLPDFINACADISHVGVRGKAQDDARDHFSLTTKPILLNFIYNGGMESPKHINTKLWEMNPEAGTPIKIDAYSFYTGLKYGYIAFRFNPNSGMWFIKSFKPNWDPDPRNLALAAQLGNFKLLV
jgi:hypothetical protein